MKLNSFRNRFFNIVDGLIGAEKAYLIDAILMSYVKFRKLYQHSSQIPIPPNNKNVISMADEIYTIGGLADRIRGIVSVFGFCKEHNLKFGIYFIKPFKLENFLMPNLYDWSVDNITRNSSYAKAYIIEEHTEVKHNSEEIKQRILEHFILGQKKEIHCYSNINYIQNDSKFCDLFNTLFKPSPELELELQKHIKVLGNNYVSISFRFVQLLGDFDDCINIVLSAEEQENLMKKCYDAIESIHLFHPNVMIFMTSDSMKFCSYVKCLPYVYIAPGEIAHVNFSSAGSNHMKTFVDFMLISRAQKAYLARTDFMFKSGFARIAAKAGNVPFEEYIIS